jgi:hypothetical protein
MHLIFDMSVQIDPMAAFKHPREEARRREVNMINTLIQDCSDVQLAQLVVQQHAFLLEVQSERHNNTNSPEKGERHSYIMLRLLNLLVDES